MHPRDAIPATVTGSPDVNTKEQNVMTPEAQAQTRAPAMASNTWRELLVSGEPAHIDGFALEHLIDLQRDRLRSAGEGR